MRYITFLNNKWFKRNWAKSVKLLFTGRIFSGPSVDPIFDPKTDLEFSAKIDFTYDTFSLIEKVLKQRYPPAWYLKTVTSQ